MKQMLKSHENLYTQYKNQSIMVKRLEVILFKIWYWYIGVLDKNAEIIFMNYGYSDKRMKLSISDKDEKNRFPIQLYHHTVARIDLKGKNVLEVGCGRGGGLSYIAKTFKTDNAVGVDISGKATEFCKRHYSNEKMKFVRADAQMLPFKSGSFDAVINIESSHRYYQVALFLCEVYRVLKPGGYFLFADFRKYDEVENLELKLSECGLQIENKQDITGNILEALTLATPGREKLIKSVAPKILHRLCRNFAGNVGSPVYKKFQDRKFLYLSYLLKKQNTTSM